MDKSRIRRVISAAPPNDSGWCLSCPKFDGTTSPYKYIPDDEMPGGTVQREPWGD